MPARIIDEFSDLPDRHLRFYYRHRKKRLDDSKAYIKRVQKGIHFKYLGVMICPNCRKKGYASVRAQKNRNTGHISAFKSVIVTHLHYENGKRIYDGYCYLGRYDGET